MTTRSQIVEAALTSVADHGWAATSMQDVRRRAEVSNGSLFHHFPTRDALAAAVLARGLADHQGRLRDVLAGAADARSGITGVVVEHLVWIAAHRSLADLFLTTPPPVLAASLAPPDLDANRSFFAAVEGWLRDHGWGGRPALPVVIALWTGPAQEWARSWLTTFAGAAGLSVAGDLSAADVSAVGGELAAGAWRALAPLLGEGVPS